MNKQGDGDQFGQFNFGDFKKWMKTHSDEDSGRPNLVGIQVESKITLKKLLSRMEAQEGDEVEIAKDFKENGGTIAEVNGHNLLIEVESGSFLIHRMYVKRN